MENTQKNQKMTVLDFNNQTYREDVVLSIKSDIEAIQTAVNAVVRFGNDVEVESFEFKLRFILSDVRSYAKSVLCGVPFENPKDSFFDDRSSSSDSSCISDEQ